MKFPDVETSGLRGNIPKVYALKFLTGFLLLTPIIVVFWQENGLNMTQVMLLQSLFAVAVVLLEVPTGYIADTFGRRKTLLSAGVFMTLGMAVYSLGHTFPEFLLGETIWAIGVSLVSGADSALLYDTLIELGMEGEYQRLWGNATSLQMVAAAIAAVLGGFLGDIFLRLTLYAQVPVIIFAIPVAYSLREPEHHQSVEEEEAAGLREILESGFRDRSLRWLMLYAAVIGAGLTTSLWLYQPYFQLTGLDVASFGLIFAGFNIVSAASSKYAYPIEDRLGKRNSLLLLSGLLVFSLAAMSSYVYAFSFAFIFLQQFARGFSRPVISDYINEMVSSDRRSTLLSAKSLLTRISSAALMPGIGYVTDVFSLTQALSLLAVIVMVMASLLAVLMWKEGVI